jgi:threonine/homoserine/homoserine lactone efflux protein
MAVETWLAFLLTETALCLAPGPAVLFVISTSVQRGFATGLRGAGGILAANALYFALSGLGVGAILVASREIFFAVKWAGALYLIWLGLKMLLGPAAPRADAPETATRQALLRGFIVQGANPKTLVFFTALLPQFLDANAALPAQLFILGATSIVVELAVLTAYAGAATQAGHVAGRQLAAPLQRIGGAFLIGAGARLGLMQSD